MRNITRKLIVILALSFIFFAIARLQHSSLPFFIPFVFAHCDTLDGPVVKDARQALEKGDS